MDRRITAYYGIPKIHQSSNIISICTNHSEADLNESFSDFANHYNVAVVSATPVKPQDKPIVANMARIVYTRIFAPLRNLTFLSSILLSVNRWSCIMISC